MAQPTQAQRQEQERQRRAEQQRLAAEREAARPEYQPGVDPYLRAQRGAAGADHFDERCRDYQIALDMQRSNPRINQGGVGLRDYGAILAQRGPDAGQVLIPSGGVARPDIATAVTMPQTPNAFGLTTPNIASLVTPQADKVGPVGNNGFSPGQAINLVKAEDNKEREFRAHNLKAALEAQVASQDNLRRLAGQQLAASEATGQQAYGRIADQERRNVAQATSQLTARGLGNSTITSAVTRGYQREANDARLGVDEMRARQQVQVGQNLMGYESAYGNHLAQALVQQPYARTGTDAILDAMYVKGQKKSPAGAIGMGAGAILGGIFGGPAGALAGASIGGQMGGSVGG